MLAYEVSNRVNSVRNNSPDLLTPASGQERRLAG
jgi:putative SOS response-associated peptidase YedK